MDNRRNKQPQEQTNLGIDKLRNRQPWKDNLRNRQPLKQTTLGIDNLKNKQPQE